MKEETRMNIIEWLMTYSWIPLCIIFVLLLWIIIHFIVKWW